MKRRLSLPPNHMAPAGDPEKEYDCLLQSHLLSVVQTYPLSFYDLVPEAEGAYPTDVLKVLRDLIGKGLIIEREGRFTARLAERLPPIQTSFSPLPTTWSPENKKVANRPEKPEYIFAEPHPADYDWRFTPVSARRLREFISKSHVREERIALLGTPTLYLYLARKGTTVSLFDRSHSLLEDIRQAGYAQNLIEHDLSNPVLVKHATFDLVLADPPWYPDFYRSFICRACELLQQEGLLLLSVLPWLTRPAAIEDRADILSFANEMGFDLLQAIPGFLAYETPTFERAALKKHGLECGDWRKGDLFVFRFVGKPMIYTVQLTDDTQWDEFRFGPLKVKLRRKKEKAGGCFSFRAVGHSGPVLDTVSRRSPLRPTIDFWTSRNVAYNIVGIDILRDALRRLENEQGPESIAQQLGSERGLSSEDMRNLTKFLTEVMTESERRTVYK